MRSTEWLSASRSVLELVPRPARIAPRAAIGDRGRWTTRNVVRMAATILLSTAAFCHAQQTNGVRSKIYEPDADKDGKADFRVETISRDGTKVMVIWSRPNVQGVLKVTSRSYLAGGELVMTESDEDKDGVLETVAIFRPGTSDLEVFIRKDDGAIEPADEKLLDLIKRQVGAVSNVVEKTLGQGADADSAMKLFRETRKELQALEAEKADAKQ